MGRFGFVFGVEEGFGRVFDQDIFMDEELEEGFDGIDLATDAFGGVILGAEMLDKAFQILGADGGSLGDFMICQVGLELFQIREVGHNGSGGAFLSSEVVFEFFQGACQANRFG